MASNGNSGGVESVGFLNDMVAQMWDYINIGAAKMVKDIVEPIFADVLPGPLKSLHFTKIDLGKIPITFDNIDVHTRSKDSVKLDVDVNWQGDCDIELKASVIGGLGVEKVKLKGRMSVIFCPLVPSIPPFSAVQVAFINPPSLELDFTGAADIADLSLIDDTIRKVIHDILASILVLPNRLLIKIDPANDYFKCYQQQLGVLRLTCVSGKGFVTPKGFFKDIPDAFCKIRIGASEIWQTSTKNNDVSPDWNETKDYLLSDVEQLVTIDVVDDDLAGDDKLGSGSIQVKDILLQGKTADVKLFTVDKETKEKTETGASITLKADILHFVPDTTSFEQEQHKAEGLYVGLLTIIIAGAKKVPGDRAEIAPNVKVEFGDSKFATPMVMDVPGMDPNNPAFDMAFRIPLTAEMAAAKSDITLALFDKKSKLASKVISFDSILEAPGLNLTSVDSPDFYTFDNGTSLSASIGVSGLKLDES